MDRHFMLKFYLKALKIFIDSASFQIILFIFGIAAVKDVHPKLYPVPCHPPPPPPTPLVCSSKIISSTTHSLTNYDQDFKFIVLIFYLIIDKRVFRPAILSADRSCYNIAISFFIIKYLSPLKIEENLIVTLGKLEREFFFFLNSACFPYIG